MDKYEVNFEPDFLVVLAKKLEEKNDGDGIEFTQFTEIVVECHKLFNEYSDNSIKVFKRMRDTGKMTEELFTLMSNKELTEEEFKEASKAVHDEYRAYCEKSNRGEIDRSELKGTYKKAIELQQKLLKATDDIIPTILNEYGLPEELKFGILLIVKQMMDQLEIMVSQSKL